MNWEGIEIDASFMQKLGEDDRSSEFAGFRDGGFWYWQWQWQYPSSVSKRLRSRWMGPRPVFCTCYKLQRHVIRFIFVQNPRTTQVRRFLSPSLQPPFQSLTL